MAEELAAEPVPSMPKLIVDDATSEAIELALAAQVVVLSWLVLRRPIRLMAGRYSSGAANFDVFLSGHANEDRRVERVHSFPS